MSTLIVQCGGPVVYILVEHKISVRQYWLSEELQIFVSTLLVVSRSNHQFCSEDILLGSEIYFSCVGKSIRGGKILKGRSLVLPPLLQNGANYPSYIFSTVTTGLWPCSWTTPTSPASSNLFSALRLTPREIQNFAKKSFGRVTGSVPLSTILNLSLIHIWRCRRRG